MASILTRLRTSASRTTVVSAVAAVTLTAVAVGAVAHTLGEEPAAAEAPYRDPAAGGLLTLCSAEGTPLTSGDVTQRPFASVVLSDLALPPGQSSAGAVGTLFAHQPRTGVGSDEFSGTALTAAHVLADPNRPAVPVTAESWSIGDFVEAYPATADGFVQLRLLLGTPIAGTLSQEKYATADIRVDGSRWEVVRGGTADCSKATELVG